ncbi:hypothetical protein FHL15_007857 [Xylaria flabelliformis]|uniref:Clr5 domain-containing protein n=1 Tax=Xylaria flabelliformis TaxID=2512241 RepID=A0A553HTH2_9PEZI|nr:hypothetical protein FHL15_007857 [Xylaria flabelliformis]
MPTLTPPLGVGREEIWEQHKATLRQLYQSQRKKLREVKTIMERDHGFPVTPLSTYESKLRQMRVRKKMKKTDWHAVYQELQRRGDRQSAVYLCGTKIPSTKAWKEIRRSGARSSHDGQRSQLPEEVVVRTPSPGRQSPLLPSVSRYPSIDSSCGVLSSQTTRPLLNTSSWKPTEIRVLDLPDTISDFYKAFLKYIPSQIFKRELFKIFEKSTFRSMIRGDHMDLMNLHYLSEAAQMLSNNLFDSGLIGRQRALDTVFTYLPTGFLVDLIVVDLPTIRVVFDHALKHLFENDRRDEFQALVRVIAHHRPHWLASESYKYILYAATMNCPSVCQLLLDIVKTISPQYRDYRSLETAIFSAASAGYFDCVRLLIRHWTQNYSLPLNRDHDTTISSNQIIAIHLKGALCLYRHRCITLRLDMETVQHTFDIFFEFGLNVDTPMSPWLHHEVIDTFRDTDLKLLRFYADLRTPPHLHPTVLDIVYYFDKDAYHYLAHHSKKVSTELTRSGLCLAAEKGSVSLHQYLNVLHPQASEYQELLELVLAEQFMIRFNCNIAYTLLGFGVGFKAFPRDTSLSISLEGLIIELKQQGMKMELLSIFNHLLREGAIIDAYVIAAAVEPDGTNLLSFLARHGADLATNGTPALLVAVILDNFEAVDWLLDTGVDINAGIDYHGEITSVIGGFIEILDSDRILFPRRHRSLAHQRLVGKGPWKTVILEQKRGVATPIIKKLIDRGAALRTHPGNLRPNNFLYHVIRFGIRQSDILDLVTYILVAQGGIQFPSLHQPCLLEACFQDERVFHLNGEEVTNRGLPIFNILLDYGAPIANSGVLAHLISHRPTMDLVQMIINRGANINAYSGQGLENMRFPQPQSTPLQMAISVGDLELVKFLIDNGASINLPAKGPHGKTALQAACQMPSKKRGTRIALVKFLINSGADVNAPGSPEYGSTALQVAACYGDIEIAALLLDYGADINALSSEKTGRRALDYAARHGRLDMTKFLLDLGAVSWDREGNDYAGAIKYAEEWCRWAVADLLREHAILSTQIRCALERDMV